MRFSFCFWFSFFFLLSTDWISKISASSSPLFDFCYWFSPTFTYCRGLVRLLISNKTHEHVCVPPRFSMCSPIWFLIGWWWKSCYLKQQQSEADLAAWNLYYHPIPRDLDQDEVLLWLWFSGLGWGSLLVLDSVFFLLSMDWISKICASSSPLDFCCWFFSTFTYCPGLVRLLMSNKIHEHVYVPPRFSMCSPN